MSMDYTLMAKKTLKLAGAFATATGSVAFSAVKVCGVTIDALAKSFKEAGNSIKKAWVQMDIETASDEKIKESTEEKIVEKNIEEVVE